MGNLPRASPSTLQIAPSVRRSTNYPPVASADSLARVPQGLDPNGPLRIAYLTYRGKPHVGGQGVYTRHLTKALLDLGHEVEVFGGQPYPVLDERITLTKLPSLDLFNDHYPGRFPRFGNSKLAKISSRSVSSQPVCSLNHWPSAPAYIATSHRASRVRPHS